MKSLLDVCEHIPTKGTPQNVLLGSRYHRSPGYDWEENRDSHFLPLVFIYCFVGSTNFVFFIRPPTFHRLYAPIILNMSHKILMGKHHDRDFASFPCEWSTFWLQGVQELHFEANRPSNRAAQTPQWIGLYHHYGALLFHQSNTGRMKCGGRGNQISMHFDSVSCKLKLKAVSEISENKKQASVLHIGSYLPSKGTHLSNLQNHWGWLQDDCYIPAQISFAFVKEKKDKWGRAQEP